MAIGMIRRAGVVLATMTMLGLPAAAQGQDGPEPEVQIVQTVGCAEIRNGSATDWWLTRATEPTEPPAGIRNAGHVFNTVQVEEARSAALGTREFQLVGFADFLDPQALLRFGERSRFTTPEQANASGQLGQARKVLVKGLLIDSDSVDRLNLLTVVALTDGCG